MENSKKSKLKQLKLNKEALKYLAPDDLFNVAGGAKVVTNPLIVKGDPNSSSCVPSSYGSSCCVP